MPLYQYKCNNCKKETEELQSLSEEALVTCEACGKDTLEKVVSSGVTIFNSGGFYETDYKHRT